MLFDQGLGFGLSTAPLMTRGKSRSICAENPRGEKGGGGKEASNLGIGRKGRPCVTLPQGQDVEIANISGAGVIQHIWITVTDATDKGRFVLRDLVLRMYWDGEAQPSVETPIGDFFCNGFGARCKVNSLPIVVNPTGGMNCYFPMPFRKGARITIENQHATDIEGFFYQVNYTLVDTLPDDAAYFHAQWRRENLTEEKKDFTILEAVTGRGQFVGLFLEWASLSRYWWGEGEVKFYIDGDEDWPTICGTGTEDYFGGAWCFYEKHGEEISETPYSTPFLGYPYCSNVENSNVSVFGKDAYSVPMHGLYRWHLMDPVRFEENLRVTIQQIGHTGSGLFERTDDVACVAYWYQTEPHAKNPVMPCAQRRWPR